MRLNFSEKCLLANSSAIDEEPAPQVRVAAAEQRPSKRDRWLHTRTHVRGIEAKLRGEGGVGRLGWESKPSSMRLGAGNRLKPQYAREAQP